MEREREGGGERERERKRRAIILLFQNRAERVSVDLNSLGYI